MVQSEEVSTIILAAIKPCIKYCMYMGNGRRVSKSWQSCITVTCKGKLTPSNISDWLSSDLKSADPASISPVILGWKKMTWFKTNTVLTCFIHMFHTHFHHPLLSPLPSPSLSLSFITILIHYCKTYLIDWSQLLILLALQAIVSSCAKNI